MRGSLWALLVDCGPDDDLMQLLMPLASISLIA